MVGRIVRTADFQRVLKAPTCSRSTHFAVHHLAAMPTPPQTPKLSTGSAPGESKAVDDSAVGLWLGAVVPKRHARRAVTRALLKRQIRAAVERHAARLAGGLWIVRLRAPFERAKFPSAASDALRHAARHELDAVLQRACA